MGAAVTSMSFSDEGVSIALEAHRMSGSNDLTALVNGSGIGGGFFVVWGMFCDEMDERELSEGSGRRRRELPNAENRERCQLALCEESESMA